MIKVDDVYKSFGKKEVLAGVSMEVDKGQVYGLVGQNGAGKTTLLNIMAGISKPTKGSCKIIDGKAGYLPDLPAFFEFMKASEYLMFLLSGCSVNREEAAKRKDMLLQMVNLEGGQRISKMSRGQRQRLGVAMALVNDPQVILLDEPTSALDPLGRRNLMILIDRLKKQGKTIVLSTHILNDMEKVCDKVGFLHNGIIIRTIEIKDLENIGCTLEDVFMEVVTG
ncbi:MAG: ABC transporter ATP-binding protein [Eubacterium sp.]